MKAATLQRFTGFADHHISIHAAREGGDGDKLFQRCVLHISIHAAREGGDYYSWRFLPDAGISIHAAREGGDLLPF